jgi:hypothetical protein
VPRAFFVVALVLGVAYAFVTPPFAVPDETLHFFRGEAIAGGHFMPNGGKPDSAHVAQGVQTLVYLFLNAHPMALAKSLPLEPQKQPVVYFPAWYTPLPYAPQATAAAICNALNVRPLVGFYAGRVANLIASLLLVAMAMRIAPQMETIFAAAALLPTTLTEFASWSADALTISLAFLLTAMLFAESRRGAGSQPAPSANAPTESRRHVVPSVVTAFALGLCKPAYFLIALLRPKRVAMIVAMAAGTALAFWYAHLAYYQQRTGLPIDAGAQLRCIVSDPLHFARVVANDWRDHWLHHLETMIGGATVVEIVLLIAVGLTSGTRASRSLAPDASRVVRRDAASPAVEDDRAPGLAIAIITILGVQLSQYLIWNIVCGEVIEGVQGRYFIPILPLLLASIALPRVRWRVTIGPTLAVAGIANAVLLIQTARV